MLRPPDSGTFGDLGAIRGPQVETGGHFGAPRFDNTRALGYKVRVLSPFAAMETYADH